MDYNIFLDDERVVSDVTWKELPSVPFTIIRGFDDLVKTISLFGIPNFISYDCDLHPEHYKAYFEHRFAYPLHYKEFKNKCGIDCAEYLIEFCRKQKIKHPDFMVHSMNEYGGGYIENLIKKYNESLL